MIIQSLLAVTLAVAPAEFPPLPWFGEDKLQHFVTSFVIGSLSASGARVAGLDADVSVVVGAGVAVAGGLLKELRDYRRGGPFSGYDLLWDAGGIAAAVGLQEVAR